MFRIGAVNDQPACLLRELSFVLQAGGKSSGLQLLSNACV